VLSWLIVPSSHRYLHINNLTNTIPSTIGQLSMLTELYVGMVGPAVLLLTRGFSRRFLSNNQLTGSIPPSIGQLTALTRLYVSGRFVCGPDALFTRSGVSNNQFTGTIPSLPPGPWSVW